MTQLSMIHSLIALIHSISQVQFTTNMLVSGRLRRFFPWLASNNCKCIATYPFTAVRMGVRNWAYQSVRKRGAKLERYLELLMTFKF